MFLRYYRRLQINVALLLIILCVETPLLKAQQSTPARPAPPNSAQQEATRPPGAPRPSPQAPPSSNDIPQQGRPSSPTTPPTSNPPQSAQPSTPGAPGTVAPIVTPTQETVLGNGTTTTQDQQLSDPTFQSLQARPVPPLPSLTRLGVTADNTLSLTLNEAIRRALENNNSIEVARNDVRFAESVLRSLEGFYDPILSFTPQINNSVRPVTSTLSGGNQSGTLSQTDLELNPAINKSFHVGGGQYQFFFNNLRQTTSSTFSNLNPIYSSSLGVTFTQPLLRDRSIDRQRRQIRVQRKRLEQSDADFRRLTTETIARVQSAYWNLVFALRDQQNRLSNLELSRQQFRLTEARIAAGAAAPLERAEVQTELSNRESDLLISSQQVAQAENNLKELILRDPLAKEWTAILQPTDEPTFDTAPVSLEDALKEARNNRQELRRLRLQSDINNIDIKYYRNQTRPRIDIQSTLSTTGLAGTPVSASSFTGGTVITPGSNGQVPIIAGDPNASATAFLLQQVNQLRASQGLPVATVPLITPQTQTVPNNLVGGYGQMISNLFGFNTRNVSVGVAIQIPLRNRTAEANLAGALIQSTQLEANMRSQEQAVEVEVRNAAQSLEIARRRVLTARAARENAELQLAGERRLFQVGRSTTFFLFQRENQLANARNLELRAQTDYNIALAELQRSTSTTMRANNVVVETPTMN